MCMYMLVCNCNYHTHTHTRKDKRHNFKIRHNAEDHDLPYDFGSIMHYGTYDFAINRRVPIITAKGGNSIRLGQRSGLSTRDIAHLKMAYCNGKQNFTTNTHTGTCTTCDIHALHVHGCHMDITCTTCDIHALHVHVHGCHMYVTW